MSKLLLIILLCAVSPILGMYKKQTPLTPDERLWQLLSSIEAQDNFLVKRSVDCAEFQKILSEGADINASSTCYLRSFSSHPITPLFWAIKRMDVQFCEMLLQNGAEYKEIERPDTRNWGIRVGLNIGNPFCYLSYNGQANRKEGYDICCSLIRHMIRREIMSPAIKTFVLCLTRMGKTDYRIKEFVRQGETLLKPYIIEILEPQAKEILFNMMRYPCSGDCETPSTAFRERHYNRNYRGNLLPAEDQWDMKIAVLLHPLNIDATYKLCAPLISQRAQKKRKTQVGYPDFGPDATPHQVLGVSSDATKADAKGAYRKLVLLFHPDKFEENKAQLANHGIATSEQAEEIFRKIQDAWSKLA